MDTARILQDQGSVSEFVMNSWRPKFFDRKGRPLDRNKRPIANALLNREEWERLDAAVIARAKQKLQAWGDVAAAGLVTGGSLAEWYSKWRVASEVPAANVTMDFETQVDEDRVDKKTYGVPVPLISKGFSIGRREIITARQSGADLELTEVTAATDAVTEKAEQILIDGDTSIMIGGNSIPGYRTLSARQTDTANGDFGTLSNVYSTFLDGIALMAAVRYHGPFRVYMHSTQYHEMLDIYTDGTGDSGVDRVLRLPQIQSIEWNDLMTAGQFVMAQLTSDVVDIRQALPLQVMRWDHPSGQRAFFVVVMAAVPRLKTDYAGDSGIMHTSGA